MLGGLALLVLVAPSLGEVFDPFDEAWPLAGGRTQQRMAAFERAAAEASPAAVLKELGRAARTLDRLQDEIDDRYRDYLKASAKFFGWRREYERDYERKYGTPPPTYPVPPAVQKGFIDRELALKRTLTLKRNEHEFLRRVEQWLAERWPALEDPDGKERAVRALSSGLKDRDPGHAIACAELLGGFAGDVRAAAELDDAIGRERDPGVLAALLEARGRVGGPGAAAALEGALRHAAWPVRAGAVRGLERLGGAEAVDRLVVLLARAQGRLVDDAAAALSTLTGRPPAPDAEAWAAWWEAARPSWTLPAPPDDARAVFSTGAPAPLGVPTRSRALVLVLDGSVPAALDALRESAARALDGLPDGARFGLVVYAHEADVFRRGLADNSGTNRDAAKQWLARFDPEPGPQEGQANVHAGLAAAFELAGGGRDGPEADTIVLHCWREPSSGWCLDPLLLAHEVTRRNRPLGLRLHAVGPSPAALWHYLERIVAPTRGVWNGPG